MKQTETPSLKTAYLIATWFYSGFSPKAPGTAGSFCTLPLAFVMASLYGSVGILISAFLIFVIGWRATTLVLRSDSSNPDPGFVVIDEVVGQLLAFIFVANGHISVTMYVLGFAFFRFFDIMKPWPACYFDRKVHTPFGVMMDDVCAGIYAGGLLGLINWWLL